MAPAFRGCSISATTSGHISRTCRDIASSRLGSADIYPHPPLASSGFVPCTAFFGWIFERTAAPERLTLQVPGSGPQACSCVRSSTSLRSLVASQRPPMHSCVSYRVARFTEPTNRDRRARRRALRIRGFGRTCLFLAPMLLPMLISGAASPSEVELGQVAPTFGRLGPRRALRRLHRFCSTALLGAPKWATTFDENRCNRHIALRRLRHCHSYPRPMIVRSGRGGGRGRNSVVEGVGPARASAHELIDWGPGNQFHIRSGVCVDLPS